MSKPKNTVNGAGWMRRGLIAVAGAAMAFTALSAAPSQDVAPVEDEVAFGISSTKGTVKGDFDWGRGGSRASTRGAGWG